MPRKARIDAPGALHHVIVRGIERKAIFRGEEDRADFLQRWGQIVAETSTPCFAWALMSSHVHLLVRTGTASLPTLMRRLLTGYAQAFNRRHRRHGQLFQNRYKSILCQEDAYLLELTRYIHLNPLRGGIVADITALDSYPYTGHAALMGQLQVDWQDTDKILGLFGTKRMQAQRNYRVFVEKGIGEGRKPELVGGGLIRSLGGWKQAKIKVKGGERFKGDERILGDSDFVTNVLASSKERLERRCRMTAKGLDVKTLAQHVAGLFGVEPEQIFVPVRYPKVVQARSLLCFWAVRELGLSATDLASQMGLTQPAVSFSVKRGEKIAKEKKLDLEKILTG
ncbi:MAG: transposase [Desulfobacteraceae bacterium]|nr:MAG: transposase [Desulfobacteraceae bacterium]